jgi:MATE family multidrug resistance protein
MTSRTQWRSDFLRLSGLNILANISVPMASLVDTAMLGRLDDIRFLAGVALAGVLFDYLYWSFGFLRMGTTGLTALADGRGDREELVAVLHRAVLTSLLIGGAILAVHRPLMDLGFSLLTGANEVEAAGRAYFSSRIWGAPAVLINFACLGWLLGRGRSAQVLLVTLIASLSNVAFNYIFIVRLGLEAYGAGLGTMLSQYLMLIANILLLARAGAFRDIDRQRVLAFDALRGLLRLNADLLVRTFCLLSTFAIFTNTSAGMGTAVLAANTILLRLLTFAAFSIDGAAFATETLAGRMTGRADFHGLRDMLRLGLLVGVGFAGIFVAAISFAPRFILGALTSHGDIVALATTFTPWLSATLTIGAIAYVFDGFFLGIAAGRVLRNSMIASLLIAFLPLIALGGARSNNHIIWAALLVFMAARVVTLGFILPRYLEPQAVTSVAPDSRD